MSRNLGRRDCYFCGGEVILVETWRTLGEREANERYGHLLEAAADAS
jgi:hypothetical protein